MKVLADSRPAAESRRSSVYRSRARVLRALALFLAGALAAPVAAQDKLDGDRYQNARYGIPCPSANNIFPFGLQKFVRAPNIRARPSS